MRELFDRMPDAVETVCRRYLAEDGSVLWPQPQKAENGIVDGLDDAYESFHSWPLAYLLGAHESLLERAEAGFDAVTRQFAKIPTGHGHPMVVEEYEQGYDWFHQGEGYLLFYYLCAAKPGRALNRERAARFSGFLQNRGVPEANFNFDTFHFRAPHVGSMGPAFRNFGCHNSVYSYLLKYYGLPFQTPEVSRDPRAFFAHHERELRYAAEAARRIGRGDVATNLAASSMALNAYLLTGDTTHRDWALAYIDGWMAKADANGGLIPDNVGLSGIVGEHTGGDWFGGNYGWVWPHGWHSLGQAVTLAMQNALLITGDSKYPGFLRRHLEHLAGLAIEWQETLHLPHKHGRKGWYDYDTSIPMLSEVLREPSGPIVWKNGWFEFRPIAAQYPVWLWEMTQSDGDRKLLERLLNRRSMDWKSIQEIPAKDLGGHYAAWGAYLRGEFPNYPERILEHNLAQMEERIAFVADDAQDPATYGDSYLHARNPVSNEGIFQLTLGASMPVYNGGLLHTRLRYFDAERHRSGLPRDVSALVERIDGDTIDLCLVNLHRGERRKIIIRAGFFAEHRFTFVQAIESGEDCLAGATAVLESDLVCEVPAASEIRLRLKMQRFCGAAQMNEPNWD